MTGFEVVPFLGLAVLTNTVFPMPFEPLLVAYANGLAPGAVVLACALGSLCAGMGALVDTTCLGIVRRRMMRGSPGSPAARMAGARFYWLVAVAALLPVPFTAVRANLLLMRPRPFLFAGIVAGFRFPRYLFTVHAWAAIALPEWAGWVLMGLALLASLELRHASALERRGRA